MTDQKLPRLSGSEYRLLDYLSNPDKSRVRADIAEEIGCHKVYVSQLIQNLKQRGLISAAHGQCHRLTVEVIDKP